jgi:ribosomal protein S18 acetylase RimI-like enzyme
MPGLEVQPFSEEHLDDAARLLAERHGRHRAAEPLLPADVDFRAEIAAAVGAEGASGAFARRDGHPVGYLVGAPLDEEMWGPNIWIETAGHAVEQPEDLRDLYAVAAERWVDEERGRQYAVVPATERELLDAWFRLGFGQQQAHGVQEITPKTEVRIPDGFEIRRPAPDEIDQLLEVDLALPRHQRGAPVFSDRPLPTEEELRKEWEETLAGSDEEVLVGYRDGRPVAVWGFAPAELSRHHRGLARIPGACYLGFASTLPETRGSGIGVALTDAGFAWAAQQAYEVMVTDWRVTNLLASRFWPRRGFRTSFLRLYRSIP